METILMLSVVGLSGLTGIAVGGLFATVLMRRPSAS